MRRRHVLLAAAVIDLLWGEPPAKWHPVVWMGGLVSRLERRAPVSGAARQFGYGTAAEGLCLGLVALGSLGLERALRRLSVPGLILMALALKPSFAARSLFGAVAEVERRLSAGDIEGARSAVGQIVSRDTSGLDGSGVAAAAIESLAENASDSVVAPLMYYSVFGLSGAYLYRMANTLDASWGYRGKYEYLGKAAARVDDLLNLIPSRVTAAAIVAASGVSGGSPGAGYGRALRDASMTDSPNAGWPMSAMAGALDVRLEKVGHYTLHPEGRPPEGSDIRRAAHVAGAALLGVLAGTALALGER